jgi:ABC-type transporter Mla MlaB component
MRGRPLLRGREAAAGTFPIPPRLTTAMSFARSPRLYTRAAKGGRLVAAGEESPRTPVWTQRPARELDAIFLLISDPISRTDIPELGERLRELLEGSEADLVVCDVGPLTQPDAVTVDALARLQLIARRLGGEIRLCHACGKLRELIALIGLDDVVPLCECLALEPQWQTKKGKQPRGIEEEADPADPTA